MTVPVGGFGEVLRVVVGVLPSVVRQAAHTAPGQAVPAALNSDR